MKLRAQQQFSFSGTLCSMAAGLPYAIGAQVGHPGRQVVSLTGDGSLSMMMGDLAALARGERDRGRISLTIGRQAMDEFLFPASDYGAAARAAEKVTGRDRKGGK